MLLKASQTFEHSTGFNFSGRRSSSHLDTSYNGEEVDNEQEMENYLLCVIALHKLMQVEKDLMKQIIPTTHQPSVFELIVKDAMDTIVQDGEVNYNYYRLFLSNLSKNVGFRVSYKGLKSVSANMISALF